MGVYSVDGFRNISVNAPPQDGQGSANRERAQGKGPKGQRRDHVTTAPRTASSLADCHAAGALVAVPIPGPSPLSRAAVIGVTSHAGKSRHGSQTPRGLTADPAHNRPRSAGSGAARHADLHAAVAVSASHSVPASRTTANAAGPLAPGRAHAPGLSPQPSRLTPSTLDARPLTGLRATASRSLESSGLPLRPAAAAPAVATGVGREAASLPAAEAKASDSARIVAPCSAPATPEAAGASATRSDATHSADATGTTAHSPSLHHPQLHPAVCAHVVNGVGTEAPAAGRHRRVDLIEQSTRPDGDGFPSRLTSTRPAGSPPAGVTTQGR